MEQNELPLDARHVGVPLGVPKMISTPVVHSALTTHLSCTEINTMSKQTRNGLYLTDVTKVYRWVRPKWFPCQ
jgi:hypothetical protein